MSAVSQPALKRKSISYSKWGYIFLIPFFATFIFFTLIPLASTFYNSFFENYTKGLEDVGPNFIGFQNYVKIFTKENLDKYLVNTVIMWILGFVPQIIVSLLLAVWFTDLNLKIKGQGFFKTVIYMPNLIMASSFAMLFFVLFSDAGPVNALLEMLGIGKYRFLAYAPGTRGLVALMNFMMWLSENSQLSTERFAIINGTPSENLLAVKNQDEIGELANSVYKMEKHMEFTCLQLNMTQLLI